MYNFEQLNEQIRKSNRLTTDDKRVIVNSGV